MVLLHGDDNVFVIVKRVVFWIGLRFGEPDVAADFIVELIGPYIKQAAFLNSFLEGLFIVNVGLFGHDASRSW